MRPVFGRPLEEHLRVTGRKIAYPIELCVCGLLELGIAEEGLFRVAPGKANVKYVWKLFPFQWHLIFFISLLVV